MTETAPEPERGMSFLEHLDELRSRLFRIALVYAVLLAGCWWISDEILAFLMRPIRSHLFAGGDIVFLTLTEPFLVYMKASAIGALFLSSPYILWQLWRFVAPGLSELLGLSQQGSSMCGAILGMVARPLIEALMQLARALRDDARARWICRRAGTGWRRSAAIRDSRGRGWPGARHRPAKGR